MFRAVILHARLEEIPRKLKCHRNKKRCRGAGTQHDRTEQIQDDPLLPRFSYLVRVFHCHHVRPPVLSRTSEIDGIRFSAL